MDCAACTKILSPKKSITCLKCKHNFHTSCTGIDALQTDKNKWNCDNCNAKGFTNRKNRLDFDNQDDISKIDRSDAKINMLNTSVNKILIKLDKLTSSYSTIEKSISFLSDKVDEYNIKMDTVLTKLNEHDKKINEVEKKYNLLQ